ncbi:hypothetical protein [Candidatus Regiella insecticola]|uniref:hypothetical protein n=1 Tax=Candidatus Regiella insecticola TaxID=138073 RepID=UPI001F3AEF12|nr:hypothetical protein [Candidatus Regiella insecticola]
MISVGIVIDDRKPKIDESEEDDKASQEEEPPIRRNPPSQQAVSMPPSVTKTEETLPSAPFVCKPKNPL